ncbi:immunoglobulin-like domain-containing protein [Listeria grandensis]|uniref:immunoglobulin-like domain-containing protein n=1 Tax=Listeria grandensis TaxID=1494963 RepID=UPI00164D97B4|nr:immunoglobulin-like domain-containing protein [Listeria grandensis]MBC6315067.1 hypothetical protein [Listeria grandensis]
MNSKMKKVISVLTVTSILGTSIVTPFNVFSEAPVEATVLATAPKYTVPATQAPYLLFTKTNVSNYLPNIRFNGSYLVVDVTKLPKGYGLQTSLPDGTIDTQYSTTAVGVAQSLYIYIETQKFGKNTMVGINVISPDGKTVERNDAILTAADFIGDLTGLQDFGQKVYNLYENTLFLHLAKGITQADIDTAYAAAQNVASSYERDRLMRLLDEMQWEFDDNNARDLQKQFNNANGAVSDLFVNNEQTSGTIKSTVTQSAIDAAKALVNQLTDSTQKTEMLVNVQLAQNFLNSSNSASTLALTPTRPFDATNAVLGLFANNNPSTNVLKPTTDQQAIDDAQKLVDGLADVTIRANMQVTMEQAKDLLKVKNTPQDYSLLANDADITSTAVTGTVGKGVTSVCLLIDGVVKATVTVNTDRTYSLSTNNFITQGSKVEVAGYTGTTEVARKIVKVSNNEKPLVPGANEGLAKQMAATAVLALFKDNEPNTNTLKPTTAQKTIDFAQNMINVVLDPVVKANMQKELDKAQNLLSGTKAPENFSLIVAPYQLGKDSYVTGQFSGSIAKISLTVNDVEGNKISVTSPDFKYYANPLIRNVTDSVKLTAYGVDGKVLDTKPVAVTKPVVAGSITSIAPYKLGTDGYVTGTFTGDITKVELQVNKVAIKRIGVRDGIINFYAKPNITKTTDVVEMVGYNSAGEVVSTKAVPFASAGLSGSMIVEPFLLGVDGYVTGTFTGDITKVELQVNKVAIKRIGVTDGVIRFYAKPNITKATDVVEMIGYNSAGQVVSTKAVPFVSASPYDRVTVEPFLLGTDGYVKGKFTADVAKISLSVNNVLQKTISVPTTGSDYQYYAKLLIKNRTDSVTLTAYDATGSTINIVSVPVL